MGIRGAFLSFPAARSCDLLAQRSMSGFRIWARRRLLLTAAVVAVLCAAACSSAPPQAATTAPAVTPCQYSESALTQLGARMWASVKSEIDGSYTDQFRDLRAVLVSVCGKPALQHYEKSTAASFHDVASVTKSVLATLVGIA